MEDTPEKEMSDAKSENGSLYFNTGSNKKTSKRLKTRSRKKKKPKKQKSGKLSNDFKFLVKRGSISIKKQDRNSNAKRRRNLKQVKLTKQDHIGK